MHSEKTHKQKIKTNKQKREYTTHKKKICS